MRSSTSPAGPVTYSQSSATSAPSGDTHTWPRPSGVPSNDTVTSEPAGGVGLETERVTATGGASSKVNSLTPSVTVRPVTVVGSALNASRTTAEYAPAGS